MRFSDRIDSKRTRQNLTQSFRCFPCTTLSSMCIYISKILFEEANAGEPSSASLGDFVLYDTPFAIIPVPSETISLVLDYAYLMERHLKDVFHLSVYTGSSTLIFQACRSIRSIHSPTCFSCKYMIPIDFKVPPLPLKWPCAFIGLGKSEIDLHRVLQRYS